jgi:hypothetical protein
VKHASAIALHGLSDLLAQIRLKQGLKEKKLGIFYRKSKAFLLSLGGFRIITCPLWAAREASKSKRSKRSSQIRAQI